MQTKAVMSYHSLPIRKAEIKSVFINILCSSQLPSYRSLTKINLEKKRVSFSLDPKIPVHHWEELRAGVWSRNQEGTLLHGFLIALCFAGFPISQNRLPREWCCPWLALHTNSQSRQSTQATPTGLSDLGDSSNQAFLSDNKAVSSCYLKLTKSNHQKLIRMQASWTTQTLLAV